MAELVLALERGKRVVAGLAEEFHVTCRSQGPEAVDDLWGIALELLEGASRDGEGHLELAFAFLDRLQKKVIHRKIAPGRNAPQYGAVHEVIVIMRILPDVEKPEYAQAVRLMYLEIETKLFHTLLG